MTAAPTLLPMPAERYRAYLESAVERYAQDNIAAGRWPAEEARARSRAAFPAILPQGLQTPGVHLYEIMEGDAVAGTLLATVVAEDGKLGAFLYDLHVLPQYRRRGAATRALRAFETAMRDLDLATIGLHVFGFNAGAQELYAKLGYGIIDMSMRKQLR